MTMTLRRGALIAATAAFGLIAVACSSSGSESTAGSGEAAAEASGAAITVSLAEFAISPAQIQAPAGEELVFEVKNEGTTVHTFDVATDSKVFGTGEIQAGQTAELAVDALDAGTYKVYCAIPGHEDLGMTGQLVVGESTSGADGSSDMSGMDMSGGTGTTTSASASMGGMTVQQMLDGHKASVEAFPAKTQGTGNQVLEPTMDHGVKVFELTASEVKWEVGEGKFVDAMAFNGQIPGPQIHVGYGDKVRIVLQNQMSQPTVLHFHGLTVPNAMDGVPYITQDPILPGGYFPYEFTVVDPPGMYVYHSHFNSTEQVGKGLYGALYVDPAKGRWPYREADVDPRTGAFSVGGQVAVDDEYTLFLGDGPLGYILNGKSFPATQPFTAKTGDWVLIHIANDGAMLHPMHLHGYHFEVVAQDGYPLPEPYMADTLVVAPGQRFDILIHAIHPGVWAYHCHILPHVEGPQGMYGMVTALVVAD